MNSSARIAAPADLARLVPALDQEFVFGKGRQISLAQRFPGVYCAENADYIFVNGASEIASALVCKKFDLAHDGGHWCGAMIGAVYTRAQNRRAGLAGNLLAFAARTLAERAVDFAVLWTGRPAFYAAQGWQSADNGVLGEDNSAGAGGDIDAEVTSVPAHSIDAGRVERIRLNSRGGIAARSDADYRRLPLPAEAVELLLWEAGGERAAYALLGSHAETGILYEMTGHPDGFSPLWRAVRRGRARLLVNDENGSPSQRWLAQHAGLSWQPKPLAMWLPLSARIDMARMARWYIPYFDRI